MSTNAVTPAPQLDANNTAFYNWLQGLVAFLIVHYQLPFFIVKNFVGIPGVNSENPEQVVLFYLICPMYKNPFYIGQQIRYILGDDLASVASIVTQTLAVMDKKLPPQPINLLAVVPAPAPPPPTNPIGQSFEVDDGTTQYTDLGSPSIPVGSTITTPDGVFTKKGRQMVVGFRTYFIKVVTLLLIAFMVGATMAPANAQITIACSPQPMAATRSVGVKVMGLWDCWITNDGVMAYTLTPSKFYQAVLPLRPIGPNIAAQILTDGVNGLPQSKAYRIGKVAVQAAAIGYGAYTGTFVVPLAVGLGVNNAPKILDLLGATIPQTAPFTGGQFTAPLTIAPGNEVPAVVLYCMKTHNPTPYTVSLPLGPAVIGGAVSINGVSK